MGPTGRHRVLQVHPTRTCNLRCLHCYSSSGPGEKESLDPSLVCDAIADAAGEGYNVLGVSGGEPLMYRPLRRILEHAVARGLLTTVTSNGMLLTKPKLKQLRGVTNLLAISLDGVPESHNRMRNSARAFEVMAARLEDVRASGIPFGFIFTLTQRNVHELDWVAGFALQQGARLLQIHPLEETGRARKTLAGHRPDEIELGFGFAEALRIQEMAGGRLGVQVDMTSRASIRSAPERVYAADTQLDAASAPLAELVAPLVLEPDGMLVPLQYGFPRAYALGCLHEHRLGELAGSWRRERLEAFRDLCRRAFDHASVPSELPFFNWYESIAALGATPAGPCERDGGRGDSRSAQRRRGSGAAR